MAEQLFASDPNKGKVREHIDDHYHDLNMPPTSPFAAKEQDIRQNPIQPARHQAEPPHFFRNTSAPASRQSTGALPNQFMRPQVDWDSSGHRAANFAQVQRVLPNEKPMIQGSSAMVPQFNNSGQPGPEHSFTASQFDDPRQCFSDGITAQNREFATKPWDVRPGSERDIHHVGSRRVAGSHYRDQSRHAHDPDHSYQEDFLHEQQGHATNYYNSGAGFPLPEVQRGYNTPHNEATQRSSCNQHSLGNQNSDLSHNNQMANQWEHTSNVTYSSNRMIGQEPNLASGRPMESLEHDDSHSQVQQHAATALPPAAVGERSKVISDISDECMERISDTKYTPTVSTTDHSVGEPEVNSSDQRRPVICTAPITVAVDNAHVVATHSSYHEALTGKLAESRLKLFCNYTMNCNRCYLTRFSNESGKYVLSIYSKERDTESTLHYEIFENKQGKLQIRGKAREFDGIKQLLEFYEDNVFDARLKNIGQNCTKADFIAAEEEKDWERKQRQRYADGADDEEHRPLLPQEEQQNLPQQQQQNLPQQQQQNLPQQQQQNLPQQNLPQQQQQNLPQQQQQNLPQQQQQNLPQQQQQNLPQQQQQNLPQQQQQNLPQQQRQNLPQQQQQNLPQQQQQNLPQQQRQNLPQQQQQNLPQQQQQNLPQQNLPQQQQQNLPQQNLPQQLQQAQNVPQQQAQPQRQLKWYQRYCFIS